MVTLPQGLQLGDIVAGKYRIVRVLGSGAMGVVVAAHHLNLDRTVAIKFLFDEALHHADAIARFVREARAAARICSTHVARVHDVAVLPSGIPYIELEYLEGCDLAARLRQCVRLPSRVAVDFILQACDAIAEAHDLGIIHRDLKPANLFAVPGFDGVETIKVLDFGISKAAASVVSTMSPADWKPGAVSTERGPIGSPCYMSPEQMQSARDVDLRTDIWSIGVTLCELVTGYLPFGGQSLVELYSTIKSSQPLRLRSRCPELPAGLEAVLLRCLEFDRELRFAHVNALASELLPFGSNRAPSYVQRIAAGLGGRLGASAGGSLRAAPPPVFSIAEPPTRTRVSPVSDQAPPLAVAPERPVVSAPPSRNHRRAMLVAPVFALAVAALVTMVARDQISRRSTLTTTLAAPSVGGNPLLLGAAAPVGNPPQPIAAPQPADPAAGVSAAAPPGRSDSASAQSAKKERGEAASGPRVTASGGARSVAVFSPSVPVVVRAVAMPSPPRPAGDSSPDPSGVPLTAIPAVPGTGALTAPSATASATPVGSAAATAGASMAANVEEMLRKRE